MLLNLENRQYLSEYWSYKGLIGTIVNWTFKWVLLEIMLIVLFKRIVVKSGKHFILFKVISVSKNPICKKFFGGFLKLSDFYFKYLLWTKTDFHRSNWSPFDGIILKKKSDEKKGKNVDFSKFKSMISTYYFSKHV